MQTRREAERRPEDAHQDVAQADVEQDAVNGRPQGTEPEEDEEHDEVAEDARHEDEAQAYRHHRVAGPAQPAGAVGRRGFGVGAEAGARQGAVCGAEVARPYADDHIWERSREDWVKEGGLAYSTHTRTHTLTHRRPLEHS